MRSRLVKESLPGLPRTNHNLKSKSKFRLHRLGSLPAVRTFSIVFFVSLALSLAIFSGLYRFWYPRRSTATNSVHSRFMAKSPLVDQTILEKISSLDLEDELNSESGTDFSIPIDIKSSYILSPFQRLPRVTRIPEVRPQAPPGLEMESQNRFRSEGNADHVPSSRKFLLPVKIEGQGANAHVCLTQLLELARALNRTLVLPNVGKNRVGACRRWRFGVYYDEQALSNKFNGDPNAFIRQDRFRAWVDSLASPPSSRLVFLDRFDPKGLPPGSFGEQINGSLRVYIHNNSDTATSLYSQAECLNRKVPRLNFIGSLPPLSFVIDDPRRLESNSNSTSQTFLEKFSERISSGLVIKISNHSTNYDSNHTQVSPDILATFWNIPIPKFQPYTTPTIHYSPQLRALATRLTRRLGPYIAVTWDVETSKADSALGCLEALRSALRFVLDNQESPGIKNIWVAGNLSPSDLVQSSESEHPHAGTFTEQFFLSDVKLTGVHQELTGMVREGEEVDDLTNNGDEITRKQELLNDSGVLEILERLVTMKSNVLVTASKSCGKPSISTTEALDWRRENAEKFLSGNLGPRDNMV